MLAMIELIKKALAYCFLKTSKSPPEIKFITNVTGTTSKIPIETLGSRSLCNTIVQMIMKSRTKSIKSCVQSYIEY